MGKCLRCSWFDNNATPVLLDEPRDNGWQFRLAAIQPDYAMTSTTFNFGTDYMRGLFNLGFSMGRTGQQWQSSLKALAASARAEK